MPKNCADTRQISEIHAGTPPGTSLKTSWGLEQAEMKEMYRRLAKDEPKMTMLNKIRLDRQQYKEKHQISNFTNTNMATKRDVETCGNNDNKRNPDTSLKCKRCLETNQLLKPLSLWLRVQLMKFGGEAERVVHYSPVMMTQHKVVKRTNKETESIHEVIHADE